MARIKKTYAPQPQPQVSNAEIENYRQFIENNPQYRFEGVLISPRERYLITIGAMKLKDGEMFVVDPQTVKRVNDMDARIPRNKFSPSKEWWDEIKKLKSIFPDRVVHAQDDEIPF